MTLLGVDQWQCLASLTSYACVILNFIDCVLLNISNLILQFFKRYTKIFNLHAVGLMYAITTLSYLI